MSRFIILIERDEQTVFPIIYGDDGQKGDCIAIYPTSEAAEIAADDTMACRAWPYTIIDLDDLP
jgi:hypothetical protein